MRKIKLCFINGNKIRGVLKGLLVLNVCCIFGVNLIGCVYKSRGDYLAKISREEDEQSDTMMQLIVDALDEQDTEALKELFSNYALENIKDLDKKIEELICYYPGCNGGVEGNCMSSESNDYGKKILILQGIYNMRNDEQEYEVNFVMQARNDKEPDKIGLYLIEIVRKGDEPEGYKWEDENSAPGIYIIE